MNYRKDQRGQNVSILGYGCMRFPQVAGKINMAETEKQILLAIENGVNYFDTAYIYPGSEAALGEILHKNNLRNQVMIATKLPHYLIRSAADMDKYFNEQLKRLKTDYVDYYLMHMLTDVDTWARLKEFGIESWIEQKKRTGQIRQIGFSYHGNSDMFCQLVDAYDWQFCQIQYNYMDVDTQAGVTGLKYAHEKGLPVVIMEPLRGGRLVNRLPKEATELMAKHPLQYTPAQWALRWLWSQKEVTCVLSGMNSQEMVLDNMNTASKVKIGEIGESEQEFLNQIVTIINSKMKVGCTGCGYCMPCPKGVDIRGSFAALNRKYSDGWYTAEKEYLMCTALRKNSTAASNCIGCGKCEQHCPQHIEIRKELKGVAKQLEGMPYKIARKLIMALRAY